MAVRLSNELAAPRRNVVVGTGGADVAETVYTPFASEPDAVWVRLIVRRVQPTPDSQLALLTKYSYHTFIADREGDTLDLEAGHRSHAEVENAVRDLKYSVGLNLPMADTQDVPPPTPLGGPCKSSPTIWCAGRRASGWASRWQPPRPYGDASSP